MTPTLPTSPDWVKDIVTRGQKSAESLMAIAPIDAQRFRLCAADLDFASRGVSAPLQKETEAGISNGAGDSPDRVHPPAAGVPVVDTHRPRSQAETEAIGASAPLPALSSWETAALLKDRTRRAIRERVRAGEDFASLATDYGVPMRFIESLNAFQLGRDDGNEAAHAARTLKHPTRTILVATRLSEQVLHTTYLNALDDDQPSVVTVVASEQPHTPVAGGVPNVEQTKVTVTR